MILVMSQIESLLKDFENDRDDDKQNDDDEQDRSVALLTTGSTSLGYYHFDLIF